MDLAAIRDFTDEQLTEQLATAGEAMFRIRFQKSMGNLEGLKRLREHKLDVARVKTIQRERVLAAHKAANPVVKGSAPKPSERTARKHAKGGK